MAQVLMHRPGGASFKAFVKVQANAGAQVTLRGTKAAAQTLAADASGVATFTVKKKDIYTVSTNADTNNTLEAYENSLSCSVLENKHTYELTCVRVGQVKSLSAGIYEALVNYIIPSNTTGTYMTSWECRWAVGTSLEDNPTKGTVLNAKDQSITASSTVTGTGKLHSGLAKNTSYAYRAWGILTLNGKTFHTKTSAAATAKTGADAGTVQTKVFSSSQNWTVPAGVKSITVFAVGGGGGAGGTSYRSVQKGGGFDGANNYRGIAMGGGGGGGYTKTATKAVSAGQSVSITTGAGGAGGTLRTSGGLGGEGTAGGSTSVKLGGETILEVAGGKGGGGGQTMEVSSGLRYSSGAGGDGGSGGAAGAYAGLSFSTAFDSSNKSLFQAGGTNGADGPGGEAHYYSINSGGKGQNTTTIFNGVTYSNGGSSNGAAGGTGTGHGGGSTATTTGYSGGSGVVVIQYKAA